MTVLGRLTFLSAIIARGEFQYFSDKRHFQSLERMSSAVLREHVDKKIRAIVKHALTTCPGYRESFQGALRQLPSVDAQELLRSIPELSKDSLKSAPGRYRSDAEHGRVHSKTTGGSTGQPVTIFKSASSIAKERAATWAFYNSYGLREGDRNIRFWGSPTTLARRFSSKAADRAMNRISLSAFAFNAEDLNQYWATAVRFQPVFLYGYSSMLAAFAEHLRARGISGAKLKLRAIVSTSEVLSEPQRALLRQTFECDVRDEYGCGEVGPIAYECEGGQLHVTADNVFVEVVDEHGNPAVAGKSGRVLVTDLNNMAMPLIRYAVGDFAEVGSPCSCGRSTATLKRVWGREYDFIELSDGRRYHGEFFLYMFEDLAARGIRVEQFQVVQSPHLIEIKLKVGSGKDEQLRADVLAEARRRLPGVELSVQWVAEISRRSSGKTALIVRHDSQ